MVKDKLNKKYNRMKNRFYIAAASLQIALLNAVPVMAANTAPTQSIKARATEASTSAVGFLQNLGKPALMVVIAVCGLIFIVGTQRQKDNWKDGILAKLVGVAMLVMSVQLANVIYGWFS